MYKHNDVSLDLQHHTQGCVQKMPVTSVSVILWYLRQVDPQGILAGRSSQISELQTQRSDSRNKVREVGEGSRHWPLGSVHTSTEYTYIVCTHTEPQTQDAHAKHSRAATVNTTEAQRARRTLVCRGASWPSHRAERSSPWDSQTSMVPGSKCVEVRNRPAWMVTGKKSKAEICPALWLGAQPCLAQPGASPNTFLPKTFRPFHSWSSLTVCHLSGTPIPLPWHPFLALVSRDWVFVGAYSTAMTSHSTNTGLGLNQPARLFCSRTETYSRNLLLFCFVLFCLLWNLKYRENLYK